MIFGKVDVTLRGHRKAKKAAAAMSTWLWGLCYIREQETDGFIPDYMISDSFVGEAQGRKDAAKLVAVGLWEVVSDGSGPDGDSGWRMMKYDAKNETKAQIDERKAADRERKRLRALAVSSSLPSGIPSGIQADSVGKSVGFPGSGSGSGSESRSRDPDPARVGHPHNDGPPANVPTELVAIPAWTADSVLPAEWREDAKARIEPKGERVDVDHEWGLYLSDRLRPEQLRKIGQHDWRGWVLRAIGYAAKARTNARLAPQREIPGGASARARVRLTGTDD